MKSTARALRFAGCCIGVGLLAPALAQTPPAQPPANAPWYSAATVVNTAADLPNWFAPNSFVAIFGTNLAYTTQALNLADIASGILPKELPGTNVKVVVNGISANVFYVSPQFMNVLLPTALGPGPATLQLEVNGIAGPAITINLQPTAPAVVTADWKTVFGVHANYTLITADAPARPNEWIFFFASGLGQTNPPLISGQMPLYAAQLKDLADFGVWIDGVPLDPASIHYAGVLPGAPGTYELIVTLPATLPHNPAFRVSAGGVMSPPLILNTP
ncbi:MAG TPA: hypothetical protein VGR73_01215 [Bryobacteraceae bacterium]|nr:hypothetical protein [Bryobacteraceae bacterium]